MNGRPFRMITFFILQLFLVTCLWSQSDNVYLDMSLEELFDVDVMVSASKRPEDLFEAPLDVTVIKQDEIIRSGATSVAEALRLAPGLIVREQSPGNFDVHIRGFDDVTTGIMIPHPTNTIMLVMIDNRIVYNYFSGGTFWESLPVDINDIAKIEVVRGPASALYGPNAAAGVINIMTHTAQKPGYSAHGSVSGGVNGEEIANLAIGHNCERSTFGLSVNYTKRDRHDELYYAWLDHEYLPIQDMSSLMFWGFDPETSEPYRLYKSGYEPAYDINRSVYKYGLNSHYTLNLSEDAFVTARSGFQESISQKAYYNNFATPFSIYDSKSYYADISSTIKGLYTQISYQTGKHDNNFYWNRYDFCNLDMVAEYQFHMKNLYVRPGISYRKSDYSGLLISDDEWTDNINQKPSDNHIMETYSFSTLADYLLANQVRFIGGLRLDKYSINENLSFTYEAGLTYRLNKNNMLRLVYSRANRAPFMLDSYIGRDVSIMVWVDDYTNGRPVVIDFYPNTNTEYLSNRNLELGWRSKLNSSLDVDAQIFFSYLDDFLSMPVYGYGIDSTNYGMPVVVEKWKFDNIEFQSARQYGFSYNVNWRPMHNLDFRLYGMLQEADQLWDLDRLRNYYLQVDDEFQKTFGFSSLAHTNLDSILDIHTNDRPGSTPTWYGGFVMNWRPIQRLNLNVNSYYSGSQTFDGVGVNDHYSLKIEPYWVINIKGSYKVFNNISAFVNARNLLGRHREYAFTDRIYNTVLFGFELMP